MMAGSETAPKMAAPFWHTHTHFNALAVNYFVVACHSNQRFGLPLALIIVIIFAGSSELANAAGKSLQGTRCQMKAPPPHAPFFLIRGKLHSLVHKHKLHTYLLPQRAFVVFAVVHNNQHYIYKGIMHLISCPCPPRKSPQHPFWVFHHRWSSACKPLKLNYISS